VEVSGREKIGRIWHDVEAGSTAGDVELLSDALSGWFGWEIISYPVGGILILAQISLRLPVQLPHEICPLPGPPVGWSPNRVRVLLLEPIEEEEKVE